MGGWYRKEIKSTADLNGLNMRIGGIGGMVLSKLGVVPQQIRRATSTPLEKGHHRRGRVDRAVRR